MMVRVTRENRSPNTCFATNTRLETPQHYHQPLPNTATIKKLLMNNTKEETTK